MMNQATLFKYRDIVKQEYRYKCFFNDNKKVIFDTASAADVTAYLMGLAENGVILTTETENWLVSGRRCRGQK